MKHGPGEHAGQTILAGWAPALRIVFIAFRGSIDVNDWLVDVDVGPAVELAEGWVLHHGFSTRAAKLPSFVLSGIIMKHRTVLCGHSLG